jgi:DNA-binding PadR family transcriptional regulator
LLEYGRPIVRYTLYVIVNELIQSRKIDLDDIPIKDLEEYESRLIKYVKKKEVNSSDLSTSSFYNNLSNLEKRGLVKYNLNHKGRIDTVEPTPLARSVIKSLLQFFMDSTVIPDFVKFDKELTDEIIKRTEKTHLDNLMGVWISEYIHLRLVNWFKPLADEVFVLSKKQNYEDYSKTDLEDVHLPEIHNKKIFVPDNMIEMVAIPNYKKTPHFYDMNRFELLTELYRLLRDDGIIILVAKAPFPLTKDIAADEILQIYKESISNLIFSKEEIIKDLETTGFKNNEIFDYKGMIVALGRK